MCDVDPKPASELVQSQEHVPVSSSILDRLQSPTTTAISTTLPTTLKSNSSVYDNNYQQKKSISSSRVSVEIHKNHKCNNLISMIYKAHFFRFAFFCWLTDTKLIVNLPGRGKGLYSSRITNELWNTSFFVYFLFFSILLFRLNLAYVVSVH